VRDADAGSTSTPPSRAPRGAAKNCKVVRATHRVDSVDVYACNETHHRGQVPASASPSWRPTIACAYASRSIPTRTVRSRREVEATTIPPITGLSRRWALGFAAAHRSVNAPARWACASNLHVRLTAERDEPTRRGRTLRAAAAESDNLHPCAAQQNHHAFDDAPSG